MSDFDTQLEKDVKHIKEKLNNLINNLNIVLMIIILLLGYIAFK
jgi:hypothetical protein